MRLRPESLIVLHELYHRKEDGKYIIGDPQTGEFMIITAAEFRALQLIQQKLSLGHAQKLLDAEQDVVKLRPFLTELKDHGFIHRIDNHVITPQHEVLHDFTPKLAWMGGPSTRYLLILFSLFGLWTLIWKGQMPSPQALFYQEYLSVTIVTVIALAWLLVAAREKLKYAAAQALGLQARLGFRTYYHLFLPKAYIPGASESQRHKIVGHGLLALTSMTSIALLLATYLPSQYQPFWQLAVLIGIIEMLCETLLFLDTDLAIFIALTTKIHKFNRLVAKDVKEHWVAFWHGKGKDSNHRYTTYSFFYMASIIVALLLLAAYIIPGMFGFLALAFERFNPEDPLFVDGFLALTFFTVDLLFYGFAVLRHHHLAHNTLFINSALLAVTAGTFLAAGVGVEWFAATTDTILTVILSYSLGIVIAALFIESVLLAHPFTKYHDLFERALLPVLAACVPVTIVFAVPNIGSEAFLYALFLAGGMLTFTGLKELWHGTKRART